MFLPVYHGPPLPRVLDIWNERDILKPCHSFSGVTLCFVFFKLSFDDQCSLQKDISTCSHSETHWHVVNKRFVWICHFKDFLDDSIPRHSMYGIFIYMWLCCFFFKVGKYTIHWVFGIGCTTSISPEHAGRNTPSCVRWRVPQLEGMTEMEVPKGGAWGIRWQKRE